MPFSIINTLLKGGSYLIYWIDKKRREGVAEDIRKSFGERFNEKEIKKILRLSFYTLMRRNFDHLLFGRITEDYFDRVASIEGIPFLEESLNKNRGVIIITLHFGSLFLIPFGLGLKGYQVNALTGTPLSKGQGYINDIKNKRYELFQKEERGYPFNVLTVGDSLKPILKSIKNNEIIGMAIDGREATKLMPIKFLKRTAQFSPAMISLSMRTGAVILPALVIRGADDKHRIVIQPPMELTFAEEKEEMLRINLEKLSRILERYVWEYPDQYVMTIYSAREEAKLGLLPPLFID